MQLTLDQVTSLAPDAGTLKRAKKLVKPGSFKEAACNDRALWAKTKGSGGYYDSFIDMDGPAYKCSCPVFKQPCKHTMALLLFAAEQAIPEHKPPEAVQTWLNKRDGARSRKSNPATVRDPKAQQKRVEAREDKVLRGLEELERFLEDAVRMGLAELSKRKDDTWDKIQRRLIDAQARGLAARVDWIRRQMQHEARWTETVFQALLELHWLVSAYRNRATLDPDQLMDIREMIGWSRSKHELVDPATPLEAWWVLNHAVRYESGLLIQSIWLCRTTDAQIALVRHFTPEQNPEGLSGGYCAGSIVDAKVHFYSRYAPLRAHIERSHAFTHRQLKPKQIRSLVARAADTLDVAVRQARQHQCRNPFAREIPVWVKDLRLVMQGERFALLDNEARLVFIAPDYAPVWQLLALMGDQSATVFLVFDGQAVRPWVLIQDQTWVALDMNERDPAVA